jgi:hypothetical protein
MRKATALLAMFVSIYLASDRTISQISPAGSGGGTTSPMAFTGALTIDLQTFKVIPPDGNPDSVAALNTPELIQQRADATWALEDPDDYLLKHPIPQDQLEAAQQASLSMAIPGGVSANETPEQMAADNAAYNAILNPGSR